MLSEHSSEHPEHEVWWANTDRKMEKQLVCNRIDDVGQIAFAREPPKVLITARSESSLCNIRQASHSFCLLLSHSLMFPQMLWRSCISLHCLTTAWFWNFETSVRFSKPHLLFFINRTSEVRAHYGNIYFFRFNATIRAEVNK